MNSVRLQRRSPQGESRGWSEQVHPVVQRIFAARGVFEPERPCVVTLGDSMVMVSEAGARDAMPAFLYVYVRDVDATCRRAIEAGARMIEQPFDEPYGDRRCMFADAWGDVWQVATHGTA